MSDQQAIRSIHASRAAVLNDPLNQERYGNDPAFGAFVDMIVKISVHTTLAVVNKEPMPGRDPVTAELLAAVGLKEPAPN